MTIFRKSVVLLSGRDDLNTIIRWLAIQGYEISAASLPLLNELSDPKIEINVVEIERLNVRIDVQDITKIASSLKGKMVFFPPKRSS